MKITTILPPLLFLALAVSGWPQQANSSNDGSPLVSGSWNGRHRNAMAPLSEDERQQLKAAHDKAIQENPLLEKALEQAHDSLEKARKDLRDGMIAADPSVAPVLEKIAPPGGENPGGFGRRDRKHEGPKPGKGGGREGKHGPPGMANLTDEERAKLRAVHEQVKEDSSIVSAREALKSATTPEARRTAHEALMQASDAAMMKIDPSVAPILEKLHKDGPPAQSGTDFSSPDQMPAGDSR